MVDLRFKLAAGCPKIAANQIMDLCSVCYRGPHRPMKSPPVEPAVGTARLK